MTYGTELWAMTKSLPFGRYLTYILLAIDHVNGFRVDNVPGGIQRRFGVLRSDHIDEMMFECGIYNENLRFPRNVDSVLNPHAPRDPAAQARLEQMSLELTKDQLAKYKQRKEYLRINLPISGEVSRPKGGYLQDIYCILEEHNRELLENELYKKGSSGSGQMDIDKLRKLVLPTQLYRIFDNPEVIKRWRLFANAVKSTSPLVPGHVSTVTLSETHRKLLVEEIRKNNVFGIAIAFIHPPENPESEVEISQHASMCEFVDITDLDTSGSIVVRAVQRLNILKMHDSDDPVVLADVSLLEDDHLPFKNAVVTHENARTVGKLYDRCNMDEAYLSKLSGRKADFELISAREKFQDKLEHMIRDVPVDGKHEYRIMELTSFIALEFHADVETRMWAANIRDTEERLACANTVLHEKSSYLKRKIAEMSGPPKPLTTSDLLDG
ncbi:ATP-dependent protease La (LON) domain family protein [Babesia bovis T2Bo]|uniref:Uncharacterized protein n=1 Tax=Babesia bovis TaxID=5865 RepID=A7AN25_BABBO|nr:ATP-dependent protease La (LON) domain family protein [Babesia bovis T2Bo]EDO07959.1 ATP-dependent protease La (LON) domain family protein [Babesia bovis T2Bo]|eukprot:XP_001611527.1 hypothetical protein [Babesia bovis T2Bo]